MGGGSEVFVISAETYHCQTDEDRAMTLKARNYKDPQIVTYSIENHPNDSRISIREDDTVQTLSGRMGTGGNNTPMCMEAYQKEGYPRMTAYGLTTKGNGDAFLNSKTHTSLSVGGGEAGQGYPAAVTCLETYRKERHPRTADEGQGWTTTTTTDTLNSFDNTENRTPTLAATEYAVRRLTPEECEILQGYPIGYTDLGEWIDSKGKVRQTTDSARYKALGNSICLPPWKWVLKRICAQYERDATMGSLFDGIGGFPWLWEQLNYPGSCLWASEIEEFPIAVTERRINGT